MNMTEKMARAMCEVAKIAPDPGWRAYAPFATAVLTALSEPTPAMLNAAVDATDAGSGMSWVNRSPQKLFEQGWKAMLAAASKEN